MDRARIADALADPGRAVALAVVPVAELAPLRAADARDGRSRAGTADSRLSTDGKPAVKLMERVADSQGTLEFCGQSGEAMRRKYL